MIQTLTHSRLPRIDKRLESFRGSREMNDGNNISFINKI